MGESFNEHETSHRRTFGQRWRAVSLNNKLIVVFAAISAFAAVTYTAFAGWTLYEIHQSSADTHTLALAAKIQADATRVSAESNQRIANAGLIQAQAAERAVQFAATESAQNAVRVERQLKTLQDQAKATHEE